MEALQVMNVVLAKRLYVSVVKHALHGGELFIQRARLFQDWFVSHVHLAILRLIVADDVLEAGDLLMQTVQTIECLVERRDLVPEFQGQFELRAKSVSIKVEAWIR